LRFATTVASSQLADLVCGDPLTRALHTAVSSRSLRASTQRAWPVP